MIFKRQLAHAVLFQFFEDFHEMMATGMSITQILMSLRDTTSDKLLLATIDSIEESISEGQTLTAAFGASGSFSWIVLSTLHAGERAGKLPESCKVLSRYFARQGDICSKLADALIYPSIVFVFLIAVMLFVGLRVIPQLQDLLPDEASGHGLTAWILMLSALIRQFWFVFLLLPVFLLAIAMVFSRKYKEHFELCLYAAPVVGPIVKEMDLAAYFLNLSVLLKCGVPVLNAIHDLNAMHPSQASKHCAQCRDYIFGGMPFWEALKTDAFFPRAVIFTVQRGEELARLEECCFNLSEYFNKRVAGKINGLMFLIQPLLLAFGGLFLVSIAFAFLVPIYGSLTKIAGG